MNNKYSYEEKVKLVKDYLDGKKICPEIKGDAKKRHQLMKHVREWTNIYLMKGEYALRNSFKRKDWPVEVKLSAIKRILEGESKHSVALSLGMSDTKSIREWFNKYSALGIIGIESNLKGIYTMKKIRYKSDEKLLEENIKLKKQLEYLQAENEYLKKEKALIQKKVQLTKKSN